MRRNSLSISRPLPSRDATSTRLPPSSELDPARIINGINLIANEAVGRMDIELQHKITLLSASMFSSDQSEFISLLNNIMTMPGVNAHDKNLISDICFCYCK